MATKTRGGLCYECEQPTTERNECAFSGCVRFLHDACARKQRQQLARLYKCESCGGWWTIPSNAPNLCIQCEGREMRDEAAYDQWNAEQQAQHEEMLDSIGA